MSNIIVSEAVTSLSTKERLLALPVPQKTGSYSPVPHGVVIDTVLESLYKANIEVIGETYKLGNEGQQVEGYFQLKGGDNEMNLRLIFHNSYDKRLPLRVAVGAHVIVCRNGMVVGDMGAFKRKHTGTVLEEFKEEVSGSIIRIGDTFEKLRLDREKMKNIEMTKRTTAELMGRLFIEDALINATQIAIIKREIENPSFNYGIEGSLWNDYNAVTVALRESHPSQSMKQHMDLHRIVAKEYSL